MADSLWQRESILRVLVKIRVTKNVINVRGICYMCGVLDSGFTKEGIWKELVYVYNRKT